MKKLVFFLLMVVVAKGFASDSAKVYARYNHVGYEPKAVKRVILIADKDCKKKVWTIKNDKGEVVLSGKVKRSKAGKTKHTSFKYNHVINFSSLEKEGKFRFEIEGVQPFTITIKKQPYAFIPAQILSYLRSARSGCTYCLNHKPSHFGDSSCVVYRKTSGDNASWALSKDGKKLEAVGGWYDAGDYIKFTLTIAYTTHMLLHSYELNPSIFQYKKHSTSEFNDLLDEAKWGLDYLMKMMPDSNEFIIQVGGSADHNEGNRLPHEDKLDGKRECYSDFSTTQMGYTAAALALGAKTFKAEGKVALAKSYEAMAVKVFNKALNYSHSSWFQKGWEIFYNDESPADNMQLAATELYKLTGDKKYLRHAKMYAQEAKDAYWASWGNANLIAHNRLMSSYGYTATYIYNDMDNFGKIVEQPGNIWGVPHEYTWASLYSMIEVANGAMLYDVQKKMKLYSKIRYSMLDYTLGLNNWGKAFVASPDIPNSIVNVYSQIYKLQPHIHPTGAVAEGPGDYKTHLEVKKWFSMQSSNVKEAFNNSTVVFYDDNTNFQTMETTIGGLGDALLFFTLVCKTEK